MTPAPANDSYAGIFIRFLRFGLLAWGGPVAQIAMIRQELVDEERWIDTARFNRLLGVYQALPGPEATELCIYFGIERRGRLGGLLAGLAFMLPGFALVMALSWIYVTFGIDSALAAGIFYGFAPAVAALIIRAVHRLGEHALHDRWLWTIGIVCGAAHMAHVHFAPTLLTGGLAYVMATRGHRKLATVALTVLIVWAGVFTAGLADDTDLPAGGSQTATGQPSMVEVAAAGLRSGALSFGGAYTAIPFMHQDAVVDGNWLTDAEFLDGIALSAALPAPLIIFATFIGYVGAGAAAAVLITAMIFLPAFAITLIGHQAVERAVGEPRLHAFLDGVTAAVIGLIAITAYSLTRAALVDWGAAAILLAALAMLYMWQSRLSILAVIAMSGLAGSLLM